MKKTFRLIVICFASNFIFPIHGIADSLPYPASQATQQVIAPAPGAMDALPAMQTVSKARLTFMDSKLFDAKLSKELEAGKDVVEVEITGRVPLNNIPPRIDRWIVKSAEEGKVELLQSEPAKTRTLFGLIPMMLTAVGIMKNFQEDKMLDQAKNYDTRIFYRKDDSGEMLIERIVMTKRKQSLK